MNKPAAPAATTARRREDRDIVTDEDDRAGSSSARCDWDFVLAATVPSTASSGASDAIGAIDFHASGRLLTTGGIARKIRIYDLHSLLSKQSADSSPEHCICVPAKLSSVRWRPGISYDVIGCGDYDGVVTEYDVERGAGGHPVFERDEHSGRRIWSVDYAPGGAMGASGSDDCTAHLWDPRTGGRSWHVIARAGGAVCCVEFDPDGGPWVAVGSADRKAYVYDVRAHGRGAVAMLQGHERAVTYVRFSGEGKLVTSSADGTHRLWNWSSAASTSHGADSIREYRGHVSRRSFVGTSVWRAGGLVASGSESDEVYAYDLRWGDPIWVRPFGDDDDVEPDMEKSRFVSAVSWRQAGVPIGDADVAAVEDDGVLVAGGSDGALQVFVVCKREPAASA